MRVMRLCGRICVQRRRTCSSSATNRVESSACTRGIPHHVSSRAPYGGAQPVTSVDDQAIDGCDHLNCSPFGKSDRATGSAGAIAVEGWAMDPNSTAPIEVHVYVGDTKAGKVLANVSRPGVDATFHRGAMFGYKTTVLPLPAVIGSVWMRSTRETVRTTASVAEMSQ